MPYRNEHMCVALCLNVFECEPADWIYLQRPLHKWSIGRVSLLKSKIYILLKIIGYSEVIVWLTGVCADVSLKKPWSRKPLSTVRTLATLVVGANMHGKCRHRYVHLIAMRTAASFFIHQRPRITNLNLGSNSKNISPILIIYLCV